MYEARWVQWMRCTCVFILKESGKKTVATLLGNATYGLHSALEVHLDVLRSVIWDPPTVLQSKILHAIAIT